MTQAARNVENNGPDKGVTLVPQPHGGALKPGGTIGNRGGHGRRPDRIKRLAQKLLLPRLHILAHIADGTSVALGEEGLKFVAPTPGERTAAIRALKEIGMGETGSVSDVRERLKRQVAVIRGQDTWTQEELLVALTEVWA
jgi:hypothetical protein